MEENPGKFVTQMDTVYNDVTNDPFLQTFKFVDAGILIALRQESKTAETMKKGVDHLEKILGAAVFRKYVHVLLTDRGSEFLSADAMESDAEGMQRTRVYYCDPMQSGQKGSLENNHIELRYIFPKETDLKALGLTSQTALNLALSHINSLPIEKFGGKSPLEIAEFMFPDLYERLVAFGIYKVPKEAIVLKPYLLKHKTQECIDQQNAVRSEKLREEVLSSSNTVSINGYSAASELGAPTPEEITPAQKKTFLKKGRHPKQAAISMTEISRLKSEGKNLKKLQRLQG